MTDDDRERLERAKRLNALSQVVGRFAHDFGNLLAAIVLNLTLIERKCTDPTVLGFAASALRAAERGAILANRLMAFAGKQQLSRAPTDLTLLISGMRDLLSRVAGPAVEVAVRAPEGLSPASIDRDQIEFALVNVTENARDAMPDGGALTIEMTNAQIATEAPDLAPGDYVIIAITDTGEGLSEEASERAFEPFFSTRRSQEHPGLGLSVVLGIAKAHGGSARLMPAAGGGSRIEIYLPRATEVESNAPRDPVTALSWASRSAKTTVLVVDDDPDLLAVVQDGLTGLGCDVLVADGGVAALEIVASRSPIDLLMVDLNMKAMTGLELIRRARIVRHGLKALIMTGGGDVPDVRKTVPKTALLRKPFRAADLARAIANIVSDDEPR